MEIHNNACEPWKVTLLDTGIETMTGGRIKRAQWFIGNEPFMLTYGDGVGDIDINKLVQKALLEKVRILPASLFSESAVDINAIRLGFGSLNLAELTLGIQRLKRAFKA